MKEHAHIKIFAALAAPFASDEVRSRSQGGREFSYITARTAMNRLDEVLGGGGWWDDYQPMENAIICRLTIRLPDGTTITKADAGGFTTTADTSDYEKSGFSDAFKRACVKFGVGRYLYGDGVPESIREALIAEKAEARRKAEGQGQLPAPAPAAPAEAPAAAPARGRSRDDAPPSTPKSGKALFAWVKERDEKLGVDLLRTLSDWGKQNHFPARMVQWSGDQVDQGHSEALRLIMNLGVDPQTGNPAPPAAKAPDPNAPRDGRELYDWARQAGALDYLKELGKGWKLSPKVVEWSAEDAAAAYHEVLAKNGVPARQRTSSPRR